MPAWLTPFLTPQTISVFCAFLMAAGVAILKHYGKAGVLAELEAHKDQIEEAATALSSIIEGIHTTPGLPPQTINQILSTVQTVAASEGVADLVKDVTAAGASVEPKLVAARLARKKTG